MIVAEITIARKKSLFATLYRSPTQTTEQFESSIEGLEIIVDRIQAEGRQMMILTGDFNCR